jgi:hypothetical protein
VAVASGRFPAGTPVDLSALNARGRRPAGWLVDLRYRAGDGTAVRLDPSPDLGALPLWFTETHHAGAAIPAVTLAACVGGDVAPGSIAAPRPAGTLVGRLRWQLRSGLVEGLAVEPAFRGAAVDRLLPVAAGTLATLRGWPFPHGELRAAEPAVRRGVERLVGDLPARLI